MKGDFKHQVVEQVNGMRGYDVVPGDRCWRSHDTEWNDPHKNFQRIRTVKPKRTDDAPRSSLPNEK
jgi:hypothetical protein